MSVGDGCVRPLVCAGSTGSRGRGLGELCVCAGAVAPSELSWWFNCCCFTPEQRSSSSAGHCPAVSVLGAAGTGVSSCWLLCEHTLAVTVGCQDSVHHPGRDCRKLPDAFWINVFVFPGPTAANRLKSVIARCVMWEQCRCTP